MEESVMNNWNYKELGFPKNHGEPAHGQGGKK